MTTIGILVGGGPAPGINGVIGAATIAGARRGAKVLGILDGFKWLMEGSTRHVRELTTAEVSRVHLQGGSILRTARANPMKQAGKLEEVVRSLEKLGVDCLITIGGDDTATSARAVSEAAGGSVRVVHVPKTIDNDLPLPASIPTFGFETAREHASRIISSLMEDARTTGRWYFAVVMGRAAGHLALGAGKAAGATLSVIPEEFDEGPIGLDPLCRLIEGSIVKRLAQGRGHGVVVLAEGIGERIDQADLEGLDSIERDEHGHIRLAELPLGKLLRDRVKASLAARGISMTIGEKNVGYELRCVPPNAFDLDYTRDLGAGAVEAVLGGASGVLITRQEGRIVPLELEEIRDPESGRTRTRTVDTTTESHASARVLQVRLEAEDLEDAERLATLAAAAGLTADEAREYFAPAI